MAATKRKRRKSNSRASRLADVGEALITQANRLAEVKTVEEANAIIDEVDVSEIEALEEEITTWKENIEEHFSSTQKYSDLETAEQELADIKDKIEECQHHITALDIDEEHFFTLRQEFEALANLPVGKKYAASVEGFPIGYHGLWHALHLEELF